MYQGYTLDFWHWTPRLTIVGPFIHYTRVILCEYCYTDPETMNIRVRNSEALKISWVLMFYLSLNFFHRSALEPRVFSSSKFFQICQEISPKYWFLCVFSPYQMLREKFTRTEIIPARLGRNTRNTGRRHPENATNLVRKGRRLI